MKTHCNLGQNKTISDICCHKTHRCWALPSSCSYFRLTAFWKWLLLLLFHMERLREA